MGTLARMGRPLLEPPPHGTRARYQWRGGACNCAACRKANAEYQADYRNPQTWDQLPIPGV